MCDARRVLVVEDQSDIRSLLETVLGLEGYAVRVADHGQAALAVARSFRPCLILLDLIMPVLDGPAFLRAYRRRGEPDARILTMSASDEEARRAAAVGVLGHVRKPFDLDEWQVQVERHVRAHRAV